jgi:hypothetical protein
MDVAIFAKTIPAVVRVRGCLALVAATERVVQAL